MIRCALALLLALAGCTGVQNDRFRGTELAGHASPDFTLTDQNGAAWSLGTQRGKVVALFFGYTHCVDTCPTTLAKLSRVLRAVDASKSRAEIAFVTIDPHRDTPAAMKRYIARFPAAPIVGLTGRATAVRAVERAYHVWAQQIPGTHPRKGSYADAHSSVVYLIDRQGRQRVLHRDDDSAASFSGDVRTLLQ